MFMLFCIYSYDHRVLNSRIPILRGFHLWVLLKFVT
eukprot:UN04398